MARPRVAHLGLSPVDDAPHGVDVRGPRVLVLQVIRVLPDVDANNGGLAGRVGDEVLVAGRHDAQNAAAAADVLLDEPAPAAALDADEGARKGVEHGVEGAPGGDDGGGEARGGGLGVLGVGARGRGEVAPEEAVVDVAAGVEAQGRVQGELVGEGGGGGGGAPPGGGGGGVVLGEGGVEVRDVGLVVLGVVEGHDLGRDGGLEGVVGVGQRRQGVARGGQPGRVGVLLEE
ncbi:hypothetical protein VDGD_21157 [Verticillium dahliae]|nr:hypothetical protein VDGD_21157 [Verticillium dahliae]